jgi:hypothetical protein
MKQDSVDDSTTVATCRQTVEGFYDAVHRLAASGYGWQPRNRVVASECFDVKIGFRRESYG